MILALKGLFRFRAVLLLITLMGLATAAVSCGKASTDATSTTTTMPTQVSTDISY